MRHSMSRRIMGRHANGLLTVTKAELIKLLGSFDDDQLVAFSYNYGDHSQTEAIQGIRTATEQQMTETAYSPSGFGVAPERAEEEDCANVYWPEGQDEPPTVVVLTS